MTTDRRELVARKIDPVWWDDLLDDLNPKHLSSGRKSSLDKADAVLAALEPWLIPELPDWVQDGNWETDGNGTAVWMHGDFDLKARGFRRMAHGEGETLADAIRNALEEGE